MQHCQPIASVPAAWYRVSARFRRNELRGPPLSVIPRRGRRKTWVAEREIATFHTGAGDDARNRTRLEFVEEPERFHGAERGVQPGRFRDLCEPDARGLGR